MIDMILGIVPVPDISGWSLPGPAWLLMELSIFTFWLHLIGVGVVLGGSCILLLRRLGLGGRSEIDTQLNEGVLKTLPVFMSFTITLGVAPLLFTQALYGQYFYTANILIGEFWLGTLGFLLVGFAGLYLVWYFRNKKLGFLFSVAVPVCLFSVLYIFTNNAILAVQPEHWDAFNESVRYLHVKDAITLPRLLHNFGAAFLIGGLGIVWIGKLRAADADSAAYATRTGLQWFMLGWVMQVGFGLWYLLSLPVEMRDRMLGFGTINSQLWYVALALAALNFVTALQGIMNPRKVIWPTLSTLLPVLGLVGMIMARQQLRQDYVGREQAGGFSIYRDWPVDTQVVPMVLFFGLLVVGLVIVGVMVGKFWEAGQRREFNGKV